MLKNVIFDIGFVLVDFDFNDYIKCLFCEAACDAISKTMWGSKHWHDLDLGIRPTEEIIAEFVADTPGFEKEARIALERFGECMKLRDFAIPLIKELKNKELSIYYLSNWSQFLTNSNPEALAFLPHMDGGIFSSDVHCTKPDKRIYELLCEKYSLIPGECIFIDDLDANVEAANSLGIHGIVYEGYDITYNKIMSMLDM